MYADVRAVAFDLDGTLYFGNDPAEGAVEAVDAVRASGRRVFFVTNNSTRTRESIAAKLTGMGIACEADDVLTSAYLTAAYASRERMEKVYVFGSEALRSEFAAAGADTVPEEDAENLVIGLDFGLGYDGIASAVRVGLRAGRIVACNRDRTYLGQDKTVMPGCAAAVGAVEACCGRQVDVLIGKPGTAALEYISDVAGVAGNQILVVGDGYDTDIRMAEAFGSPSLLIGDVPGTPCIRSVSDVPKILEE